MVLHIRGEFELATINVAKYKKDWQKQLQEANLTAVLEWLIQATEKIPVWSGASMATFSHLAGAIGFPLFTSSVPGVRSREGVGRSRSKGGVIKEADGLIQGFEYKTSLAHLIYNEFFNANASPDPTLFSRLLTPGPYNFLESANAAAVKQYQKIQHPIIPIKIRKLRSK